MATSTKANYGGKAVTPLAADILFNTEIEKTILSTILYREDRNFLLLTDIISEKSFYDKQLGKLFGILKKRYAESKPVTDYEMVAYDMQKAGEKDFTVLDLMHIAENTPMVLDAEENARKLRELYQRRELSYALLRMGDMVTDFTKDMTQVTSGMVKEMLTDCLMTESSTINLGSVMGELRERIHKNYESLEQPGVKTGFSRLDEYGGLHPSDLVIIGADSSQGKTSMGINILMNAVRQSGARALVFSLEMSNIQLGARILSPETGIPASVLMYKQLNELGLPVADASIERLMTVGDHVYFGDASVQTVDDLMRSIRLHHLRYGVNLVMIDYLQIISMPNLRRGDGSKEQALADAARQCKNIAKELGITVLLMSQLNRDTMQAGNPEPTVSRLRGSGEINEASDLTVLIYRPEVYNRNYPAPFDDRPTKGTAMIKVVKDRNGGYGGIGAFIVNFDGSTMRFYEE